MLLLRFDRDLAAEARRLGCLLCGGRLDSGNYPRKPRGGPPISARLRAEDPDHSRRLSLCCDRCRRRTTPPSVRFLGRRYFLAATVVLVSAFAQGLTPRRRAQLRERFDVSARTLERWRAWWREAFVDTDLWRAQRPRFVRPVREADLPRSLLARFGEHRRGVVSLLGFLGPLGASDHARRRAIAGPQRTRNDRSNRRS